MNNSKKAVIFGAGNIGRGLVGRIFNESGYESVFVDVNMAVVDSLNAKRQYPLYITMGEDYDKRVVDNVRAVDGRDIELICCETDTADIIATAIGVNVLPIIAKTIAAVIKHRIAQSNTSYINFILCENKIDSHLYVRELLKDLLSEDEYAFSEKYIGFCQSSIGCMVPAPPKELIEKEPLLVCVEDYNKIYTDKSGAVGELPEVKNIIAYEPFDYYIDRKLFMHNMSHCVTAFLGYLKGYTYIWEAISDDEIKSVAYNALNEASDALSKHYKVDISELHEHRDDLLFRYTNKLLGDTILRVGADPVRKLSVSDRLVGAAKFCLENGVTPANIAKAIAAGYKFAPESDKTAPEIQTYIAENGIEKAICKFSSLNADESLYKMIIKEL